MTVQSTCRPTVQRQATTPELSLQKDHKPRVIRWFRGIRWDNREEEITSCKSRPRVRTLPEISVSADDAIGLRISINAS